MKRKYEKVVSKMAKDALEPILKKVNVELEALYATAEKKSDMQLRNGVKRIERKHKGIKLNARAIVKELRDGKATLFKV